MEIVTSHPLRVLPQLEPSKTHYTFNQARSSLLNQTRSCSGPKGN